MDARLTGAAIGRRQLLTIVGGSAAALVGGSVLAGCAEKKSSGGSASDTTKLGELLPKYKELSAKLPTPDVKGVRPIADGYTRYPTDLVSVVTDKPGKGGTIKAMTPQWGTLPPALADNAFVQGVNAGLGATVDFSVQDGVGYAEKVNAILGARDVPDLLGIPQWEIGKIPRFTDAANTLFEDLTPHLQGDIAGKYPLLANLPTEAWQNCVWDGKLFAIPSPGGGFGWFLFHRKDLFDAAGLSYPKSLDELMTLGREITKPEKSVWAFDDIFPIIQMAYGLPGDWRLKSDGKTPEHKYETPEYREALEQARRLFDGGMVHPEVMANNRADKKQLFKSGSIWFMMDGPGAWQGTQSEQQKITPTFNIQPVPYLAAPGRTPVAWYNYEPTGYCFMKKGLGKDRVEEILRVVNYLSAPFGTKEWQLSNKGVEGKHFTPSANGPTQSDLGRKEMAGQYFWISGRPPVQEPTPDTPDFPRQTIEFGNSQVRYAEKDPWLGIKLEWPAKYSAAIQPNEDKISDILRGRRPVSDVDAIVKEWRSAGGGDETRDFLAKALADNK